MRKRFLMRILIATAAVLVIGRDRRVVVAGDAGNPPLGESSHDLVRPRRVSDEIAEMIRRVGPLLRDVGQHGVERGEVAVNIGDQRVSHVMAE